MFSLKIHDPVVIIHQMNTGVSAVDTTEQEFEADVLCDINGVKERFSKQNIIPPNVSTLRTEVNGELAVILFEHANDWRLAEFKFSTGDIYYSKLRNGIRLTKYMDGKVIQEFLS